MNTIISKLQRLLTRIRQKFNSQKWPTNSIVYYTGHTDYEWTPDSLKTGIGGSETAIIYLSQEWINLGYQVTVFNNCGTKDGNYQGVNYYHYSKFNPFDSFDILIIWRYPWRLEKVTKANQIWLDLHEVLLPEQVTKEKLTRFKTIFVKSKYHRSLLPEIEDKQIKIIPNGVSKEFFKYDNLPKQPYKIIYASNYGRGLEKMLEFGWPIIKKEIPEAELHIYYGWSIIPENKPQLYLWKEKMLKLMTQEGIKEQGKIGVEQLIKEKATSLIHYYGCNFQEIDCISLRESAIVGCVPVTTDYAVLGEKSYCLTVSGSPFHQETQEKLAYKIVELLKNPQQLAKISLEFKELAKLETWDNIAQKWFQ
jgi:hypothetical protein